jgi:hypothetical protein
LWKRDDLDSGSAQLAWMAARNVSGAFKTSWNKSPALPKVPGTFGADQLSLSTPQWFVPVLWEHIPEKTRYPFPAVYDILAARCDGRGHHRAGGSAVFFETQLDGTLDLFVIPCSPAYDRRRFGLVASIGRNSVAGDEPKCSPGPRPGCVPVPSGWLPDLRHQVETRPPQHPRLWLIGPVPAHGVGERRYSRRWAIGAGWPAGCRPDPPQPWAPLG